MSLSLLNKTMVNGAFAKALDIDAAAEVVSQLCLRTRSDGASTDYAFADSSPAMGKFSGTRKSKVLGAQKVTITNEEWENSVTIRAKDLRRDQSGTLERRMAGLAERVSTFQWKLIIDTIKANTALAYDGIALFSASHVYGKSGTQKNLLTSSEVASLDIATAAAPTPEEAVTAVLDVIGYMGAYLDDDGEPMNENAKSFTVLVPQANMFGAFRTAVGANNLTSGKTNMAVVLNADGFNITVKPTPRLTTTTVFYVARNDGIDAKPFIMQEELPPTLQYWDENSDFYKDSKCFKVACDWEGNVGVAEPLHIAKCTFS